MQFSSALRDVQWMWMRRYFLMGARFANTFVLVLYIWAMPTPGELIGTRSERLIYTANLPVGEICHPVVVHLWNDAFQLCHITVLPVKQRHGCDFELEKTHYCAVTVHFPIARAGVLRSCILRQLQKRVPVAQTLISITEANASCRAGHGPIILYDHIIAH